MTKYSNTQIPNAREVTQLAFPRRQSCRAGVPACPATTRCAHSGGPGPAVLLVAWVALAAIAPVSPLHAQSPTAPPFTYDHIQGAIQKAISAIYLEKPNYTFGDMYALRYIHGRRSSSTYQEIVHGMGNHAVACWALLEAGESYQNPPLYRRINWVLSGDQPFAYDRGMRAQMLAQLPAMRWDKWIHREYVWLSGALTDQGGYDYQWTGGKATGFGDNANAQYGVLGIWGCERGGHKVPNKVWQRIDSHWRKGQKKIEQQEDEKDSQNELAAGWSVIDPNVEDTLPFFKRISGPMTAGGVMGLMLTERALYGQKMTDVDVGLSPHLTKGINWLDTNFSLTDQDEASDWYYYMWTIQSVGRATGYSTFNGVDWFRDVTAEILARQQGNGMWTGPKGALLSTSFAILYLSRANDPLAVSKIRFKRKDKAGTLIEGRWNNRPHDMWNFVDYVSDECEYAATWQITEIDQPVYAQIESPMLYLASDRRFEFSDEQVSRLRAYIDAGGLLVFNREGGNPDSVKAFRELCEKLYPGRAMTKLDNEHDIYKLHQQPQRIVPIDVIDNGVRPLVMFVKQDIGKNLQNNRPYGTDRDAFITLSNLYLYITGLRPQRARLAGNYVVQTVDSPAKSLTIARVRHNGNFDPEPGALQQIKAIVANEYGIDLKVEVVDATGLSLAHKLAVMTTMADGELPDDQATALRQWLDEGGTLWLDATGGKTTAVDRARAMLKQITPEIEPSPLPPHDPVISGKRLPQAGFNNQYVRYRLYASHRMGPNNRSRLYVVPLNDRPAIIFSEEDLTTGWAGLEHWGIFGYDVKTARQLFINGLLAVMPKQ